MNLSQRAPNSADTAGDDDAQDDKKIKRRRIQPSLDRNYHCPQEGCNKSYSRAEHLYRHQLNHAPKQIYKCDFPDCDRQFVRQDLCVRHKDRHLARKSGLVRTSRGKMDSMLEQGISNASPNSQLSIDPRVRHDSTFSALEQNYDKSMIAARDSPYSAHDARQSTSSEERVETAVDTQSYYDPGLQYHGRHISAYAQPQHNQMGTPRSSHGLSQTIYSASPAMAQIPATIHPQTSMHVDQASYESQPPDPANYRLGSDMSQSQYSPSPGYPSFAYPAENNPISLNQSITGFPMLPSDQSIQTTQARSHSQSSASMNQTPLHDPNSLSMFPTGAFGQQPLSGSARSGSLMSPPTQAVDQTFLPDYNHEVGYSHACSMPIFTHGLPHNAPFVSTDEFATWLLDPEASFARNTTLAQRLGSMQAVQGQESPDQGPRAQASAVSGSERAKALPAEVILRSSEDLDTVISPERRRRLLSYIIDEFRDSRRRNLSDQRRAVLSGDHNQYPHVLSPPMLQAAMSSYWTHIDPKVPIMHRPTYDTDTAFDLLIIAQIALGASCLDASFPNDVRQRASDLANFLLWHARYKLYQDVDFGPPAKLWVLQTLLLVELGEKMVSTRALHERGHVHHATTVALMRRGSSLVGHMDSPPFTLDQPELFQDFNGAINMSEYNTADTEFNKWISAEAMRRVAFAAFIVDTLHASIFGHTAIMVPHEMRMRLPCEDYIWTASNYSEVQRMETALKARGHTDLRFDDALRRTLYGQSVQTNAFGRVSIMAGLLSISWHLKMQDIRVSSVGIGKRSNWTSKVSQAIDFWRQDFDQMRDPNSHTVADAQAITGSHHESQEGDEVSVLESPLVLHRLAHMTLVCDVLEYQIYAGATLSLGRFITTEERQAATRKVREVWAPSAPARDAVFHAVKFLSETLLGDMTRQSRQNGIVETAYDPRQEVTLSRPWVMYIAVLVVWSYGYALDGSIPAGTYSLVTHGDKANDLYGFLCRIGGISCPDDLMLVRNRNACLGLVMIVRDMLRSTRWELLHDAAAALRNCIELLSPGITLD